MCANKLHLAIILHLILQLKYKNCTAKHIFTLAIPLWVYYFISDNILIDIHLQQIIINVIMNKAFSNY